MAKTEIVYRKVGTLTPMECNPRTIDERQFKILCDSIRKNPKHFEARPCILSNRTGQLVIIAGNMRYRAATAQGFSSVPTVLLEGLTEENEREIMLRDNISSGKWDWDALANETLFTKEQLTDFGLDLPDFGKLPPMPGEGGPASGPSSKMVHTCPSCGHQWKKGE